MSLSKPEAGASAFSASSAFNSPVFNNRYDRFCGECSGVLVNVALERIPNFTCGRCKAIFNQQSVYDGLYRRCVRCYCSIRCTAKFCENCGRENHFYDPERPSRIEKSQLQSMKEKLRIELRKEIRAELEKEIRAEIEAEKLSQSCLGDGDFDDDGKEINKETEEEPKKDSDEQTNVD